ncbi:MAG: glycosyltransferase family A protein [Rhodoferax sp.]|nr:glycosyltransferase family A protein [Rhodoferax sp.]
MEILSLFILCHNRPDDARLAIRSVLAQSDKAFSLTVSDNSSNDEVQCMIQNEYPDVHYVRRLPMLPALEHFNRCIDEVQTGYFCLFHDDDLMGADFVAGFSEYLQKFPEMIAYACNAHIESFGKLQQKLSFLSCRNTETISSPRVLAARYFSRAQLGIAPFPAYVYSKERIGKLRFEPDGGKYADVTWLLGLSMKGPVLWISRPLMTYRIHASNDGATESRRDRLRFLAFIKKNHALLGNAILQDYRCSFVYKTILKSPDRSHPIRRRIAKAFVKHYRWARYARLETYQALAKRVLVKWLAST